MRDRGIWRQMDWISRVESGNEGQRSLQTDVLNQKSWKWQWGTEAFGDRWIESVQLKLAMRDRGVWRQMIGVSRVENVNDGQRSLETWKWQWGTEESGDRWLESVQLKLESGNEGQRSLETDGWSQYSWNLKVAMRDRGVWRQMVGVGTVETWKWQWGTEESGDRWLESVQLKLESGNEGQRSLETDGWGQQRLTPAADKIEREYYFKL